MVVLVVAAMAMQAVPPFWRRDAEAWIVEQPVVAAGRGLRVIIVAADAAVGQQGVAPFIYFRF